MRPSLTVALALLAASALAPTALASPSQLSFQLPERPILADDVVPVNVTLTIHDFMCSEPRDFVVSLHSNATDGVKATFALTSLTFSTPAHAYFAEPYTRTQTVNLTVRALHAGQAELTAVFAEHDVGPCLAPDGFMASTTTVLVQVQPPAAAPPPPAPTPTNETGTDGTNATPPAPEPRPTPTPGIWSPTTCAPDTQCGYIGEYDAPAESAGGNGVPGLGVAGAAIALTFAAVALRRRKP